MKPVKQTILGRGGNCYAACIASLLEQSLERFPNFCSLGPDWMQKTNEWMATWFGLRIIPLRVEDVSILKDVYHIMSGQTERGLLHSVVGMSGKMIFDPHPSAAGLVTKYPVEHELLVPLHPWRYRALS